MLLTKICDKCESDASTWLHASFDDSSQSKKKLGEVNALHHIKKNVSRTHLYQ